RWRLLSEVVEVGERHLAPYQFLLDDELIDAVRTPAAVLGRPAHADPALLGDLLVQGRLERPELLPLRPAVHFFPELGRDVVADEVPDLLPESFVLSRIPKVHCANLPGPSRPSRSVIRYT